MKLLQVPVLALVAVSVHGLALEGRQDAAAAKCRCVPGDACWPSDAKWKSFGNDLGANRLIKNTPIAQSCYGQNKDNGKCANVVKMWPDQDFQTENPIGRPLPWNITCAPVDYAAGWTPTTCIMGQSPTYAVNVTTRKHVQQTLKFAQDNNIRITVVSTGHDLNGRSDGYGSLEIWLRYFRNAVTFQKQFESASKCSASKANWNGNAIKIDGAYQWRDVLKVGRQNNVVVVSGGSVSPGAIGGWPTGGGHGPASRTYGLGADQILEAEVMLANGTIVVANACQYTDLYKSVRGGGPNFGVILGMTIKAHPNLDTITAHRLQFAPLKPSANNSDLLDAVTLMLQNYFPLNDFGFAGTAYWFRNSRTPVVNNATSGFSHSLFALGKNKKDAQAAFAPTAAALDKFKDRLFINSTWISYTNYYDFYFGESGQYDPAGLSWASSSRMINQDAVKDRKKVRDTVEIISGKPQEYQGNVVTMVSGGQVYKDGADPNTGLNPAWRKSPYLIATWRNPAWNTTNAERQAIDHDITYVKGMALKKLAPNTGSYMNEGDRNDPDYIKEFYGSTYPTHLATKKKYDPNGALYCPTCVGAEAFKDNPDGALCRV